MSDLTEVEWLSGLKVNKVVEFFLSVGPHGGKVAEPFSNVGPHGGNDQDLALYSA